MRLEQDHLAKIKTYIHGAQAGFIVLAWALTIGIFSQPGSQDGRVYWYFALVSEQLHFYPAGLGFTNNSIFV